MLFLFYVTIKKLTKYNTKPYTPEINAFPNILCPWGILISTLSKFKKVHSFFYLNYKAFQTIV
jgi:hypothetical protein